MRISGIVNFVDSLAACCMVKILKYFFFGRAWNTKAKNIYWNTRNFSVFLFEENSLGRIKYIAGSVDITALGIDESVNFFGLKSSTLGGFKEAARGAVLKMLNSKLENGIHLMPAAGSKLHNSSLSFVDDSIFLQANADIESDFYRRL